MSNPVFKPLAPEVVEKYATHLRGLITRLATFKGTEHLVAEVDSVLASLPELVDAHFIHNKISHILVYFSSQVVELQSSSVMGAVNYCLEQLQASPHAPYPLKAEQEASSLNRFWTIASAADSYCMGIALEEQEKQKKIARKKKIKRKLSSKPFVAVLGGPRHGKKWTIARVVSSHERTYHVRWYGNGNADSFTNWKPTTLPVEEVEKSRVIATFSTLHKGEVSVPVMQDILKGLVPPGASTGLTLLNRK